MPGLILVEGLPGSGKTTAAAGLADWLTATHPDPVQYWPEGGDEHPADFESVAVLTAEQLERMRERHAGSADALAAAAELDGGHVLVRYGLHPQLPREVVEELRAHDAYDGDVSIEAHHELLTGSWRRYGHRPLAGVQVWECVLIQNPVCAYIARFDRAPDELHAHVAGLLDAV